LGTLTPLGNGTDSTVMRGGELLDGAGA